MQFSTQLDTTPGAAAVGAGPAPLPLTWLARRRIAISLIGFTTLVIVNIFVIQSVPLNPLQWQRGTVQLAWGLILIGLGIRSWSAGTLNKSRELTTHGPYSVIRNPLYVGSFMMMLGFCLLCRDWLTMAFVCGPLSLVYRSQVLMEESRLARLFPNQWPAYMQATPRFFPRRLTARMWTGWKLSEWLRNREYKAISAAALGMVGIWLWALSYIAR